MNKFLTLLFLVLAIHASAGITFNASADEGSLTSFPFNAAGTAHIKLVLAVFSNGTGTTLSAATFNGVSMTQDVVLNGGANGRTEMWTLSSPTSGSHTLTFTFSGITPTVHRAVVGSWDGVTAINAVNAKQLTVLGGSMSLSGTATPGNWSVFLVNALAGTNPVIAEGDGNYTERRSNESAGTTYTFGDEAADASTERFSTGSTNTLTGSTIELVAFVPTPTPTFTFSPTASPTSSITPSATPTFTATRTVTQTSAQLSATLTSTPTPTNTPTLTITPTKSPTPTATPSPTVSPSYTVTPGLKNVSDLQSEWKQISNQDSVNTYRYYIVDKNGVPISIYNPLPVWSITPNPTPTP